MFQEKIDRTLNCMAPAWLDDIIAVAGGTKQKQLTRSQTISEEPQKDG